LSEKTHLRVKYKFGTIFIFFKGEIENTIFIRRSLLSDNTPNNQKISFISNEIWQKNLKQKKTQFFQTEFLI
jgi:hypothetical protein